mmetsp:Transcript_115849/g.289391  ORF Transcript_115849/g.289391 Transcript_115849/m.289391 type:complete len:221 (-) Transcript_115849:1097-1759(-)
MHTAADLHLRQPFGRRPAVQFVKLPEHLHRGSHRARRVVLVWHGRTVHGQDRVADEFDDDALVVVYDLGHIVEVPAQQQERLLRRQGFDDGGERRDVGEENGDLLLPNSRICILASLEQDLHHWPRNVLTPRLDRFFHLVKDTLNELDLRDARLLCPLPSAVVVLEVVLQAGQLKPHDVPHLVGQVAQRPQQPPRHIGHVLCKEHDARQNDHNDRPCGDQ